MKQSEKIFIAAAEEQSLVKAAKRSFVTQQCVSDHIKRLEEEYGLPLFVRKPHLRLTTAGEDMLKTLKSIQVLENNLTKNLEERKNGQLGSFTVGMSTSRAQILLPAVLTKFYRLFPDVKIYFSVNDTMILEKELKKGTFDLMLGVNTENSPEFSFMPLAEDELYLCISASLFAKYFSQLQRELFLTGADLTAFQDVPFSLYYTSGALNKLIQQYLNEHRTTLRKTPYYISDCDTHIFLCESGLCATLIPKMLAFRLHEHNLALPPEQQVLLFPLKDFHYPIQIDMVWNKNVSLPIYAKAFCEMIKEEAERIMRAY